MFYRRKILLALLEKFGGRQKRTDFQKLLFLYCQYTQKNYYDFFPYKYGSFSFLVSQDKSVLQKYGYLKKDEDFLLNKNRSTLNNLKGKDQKSLHSFYNIYRAIKGRNLIRHSYLKYPEYTTKSQMLNAILSSSEIDQVQNWWNSDESDLLSSIGYEGLTIDSYLKKLIFNNIKALVDVRRNPISMKYGFSKTRFKNYLEKAGIKYFHIPQLGIPSNLRQNLDNADDYKKLFNYYDSTVLPNKTDQINEIYSILQKYKRVALTCFEKEHQFCHRHRITHYFETNKKNQVTTSHI